MASCAPCRASLIVQQLDLATNIKGHPFRLQRLPTAISSLSPAQPPYPRERPPHRERPLQFGSLADPQHIMHPCGVPFSVQQPDLAMEKKGTPELFRTFCLQRLPAAIFSLLPPAPPHSGVPFSSVARSSYWSQKGAPYGVHDAMCRWPAREPHSREHSLCGGSSVGGRKEKRLQRASVGECWREKVLTSLGVPFYP